MFSIAKWLKEVVFKKSPWQESEAADSPDRSENDKRAGSRSAEKAETTCPEAKAPPGGAGRAADGEIAFWNGQFVITPPVGAGLPPVLIPDDSVILTIDGLVIAQPVSLLTGKTPRVRPRLSASPVREFQIEVAPDLMAAYLTLSALGPPGYRVKDCGPGHTITLAAEPLPGLQANPTVDDIVAALNQAGVVRGIHQWAIRSALAEPGRIRVQVASGCPPVPGRPGGVESLVDGLYGETPHGLGVAVEPGQVLARLIPPEEGQPGYDVAGQVLEPTPARQVRLRAGSGTQLSGDGTEVAATVSGRPVLLQLEPDVYRAAVVPVTKLSGPLVESTEPYRFEGDVLIEGDVGGGVTLQAGGWIWVKGSVHGATLEACQGIWVDRSVKWAQLTTRATRVRLTQFQRQMQAILADLTQMCEYARHIVSHPRYAELTQSRSFGEIMLLLAQQQFERLQQRIRSARRILAGLNVPEAQVNPEAVLNALEHSLYSGSLRSIAEIAQFIDALAEATQRAIDLLGAGGSDAPIHAYVLIGSEVDADGDVVIHGSGAEQSVIRASGSVQVNYLRDSRVKANAAITVETVAASLNDSLLLEVATGGRIRVGTTLMPAPVRIGDWSRTLAPRMRNVEIESDYQGRVNVVHTTSPNQADDPFCPPDFPQHGGGGLDRHLRPGE